MTCTKDIRALATQVYVNKMAKACSTILYDADTLLHPNHHPVSIWDSEDVLVHQVVSMKKMNEKPGHVRPENGFYDKLNALMFVPQKDLSGDQAYWLSANEIASQASKPTTPATPFVHKSRPPSQVLASLQKVNAVFHQFEGIITERTTQKPDYVSEWCYDYAKQFVEQQLVPFYDHFKKHIQAANDTFFKEIKEYEQIFDDLEAEYEQCVLDNKNLTIEKKKLFNQNEWLNVKPTSGASKIMPKRALQNHSSLPVKSANARRVEAHHRTLNKKNRVNSNLLVKHSVSISDLNSVCGAYFFEQRQTPQVIEKFIVKTQRALNATVRFVRTDNGTEFVNKTLDGWFESVGISHEQAYLGLHNRTALSKDGTVLLCTACYTLNRSLVHTLHEKTYYELLKGKKPNLQYFRVFGSLCYPTNDYDKLETVQVAFDELTEGGEQSVQTSSGLAPQQMTSVPNSTELELTALQSGRSRSALVKDPEPPSVPPTEEQVDDLFQWFDDDEVVPIPPVVPITPVNVPAPENANGSPSTTVISEGAPAVTESLLPHQIPLPDTSDSDVDHTVIRTPSFELKLLQMQTMQEVMTANRRITLGSASILGHPSCYIAGQPKSKKITAILQQTTEAEYIALLGS
ncbi:retrovirus-related pol polyprotein from transposon TNT 1-94 [Tanacetum coccineum]